MIGPNGCVCARRSKRLFSHVCSGVASGKFDIEITLESDKDVDVQLYDLDDKGTYEEGKAVIAWCSKPCNAGILGMKSGREEAEYKGDSIVHRAGIPHRVACRV